MKLLTVSLSGADEAHFTDPTFSHLTRSATGPYYHRFCVNMWHTLVHTFLTDVLLDLEICHAEVWTKPVSFSYHDERRQTTLKKSPKGRMADEKENQSFGACRLAFKTVCLLRLSHHQSNDLHYDNEFWRRILVRMNSLPCCEALFNSFYVH